MSSMGDAALAWGDGAVMQSRPMRRTMILVAALTAACTESAPTPPRDAGNDLALDVAVDAPKDVAAPDVAPDAATQDVPAGDARPMPAVPFSEGPYGMNVRDRAAPFVMPTQDGDWSFRDQWTGEDSYVFLVYAARNPPAANDYTAGLFNGSLAELLERSPRNVHYFFLSGSNTAGFMEAQASWQGELDALPEEDARWWRPRVHFVATPVSMLDNWVGQMLLYRSRTALPYKRYDAVQFAIDRDQRIREVGMLGRLASTGTAPDITLLANEPAYYNWEHDRDARLARERATVVTLARAGTVHDTLDVDVDLPDAATMATFDTMEVDLAMECPHHRDGECGAWDYLSYLWVCDPAAPDADAGASDGGDAGGPRWRCDNEIARWITSYWRETHWVTDISGMLPFLRAGGRQHLRWNASGQWDPRSTDYIVTLSLRLSNRGRGMRPVEAVPLWRGGAWNAMYDMAHPPVSVDVPSDVRRVELYALITGHGGVRPTNCAEFCNHEHRFTVGGMEYLRSFPGAQSPDGCAMRVNEGVVPNQFGTWYFGRGGWCPGFDVAPWVVDVTANVRPGMRNELSYRTTFGGRAVTAGMGDIALSSYLVYWR